MCYYPCYPLCNPSVSRSPDNELWVLILEKVIFKVNKAVAKVYECYFTFNLFGDLLIMLTGCPTFNLLIEESVQEQILLLKINIFVVDLSKKL